MNPMNVLAPNYMGDSLKNLNVNALQENIGLKSETDNIGLGIAEVKRQGVNVQGREDQKQSANPGMDKLRRHKAREFGLSMETVGF